MAGCAHVGPPLAAGGAAQAGRGIQERAASHGAGICLAYLLAVRHNGRRQRGFRRRIGPIPVLAPLGDVAVHVEQAEVVRLAPSDGLSLAADAAEHGVFWQPLFRVA